MKQICMLLINQIHKKTIKHSGKTPKMHEKLFSVFKCLGQQTWCFAIWAFTSNNGDVSLVEAKQPGQNSA